ncbi:MAG TPA: glycerol kinase, partial [Blastocatellia bacterium]|nr:glycerol kinase [Blastocatellia bacterium]
YLAGLAVNFWKSEKEISALWREETRFEPQMRKGERERLYEGWKEAVARARG